MNIFLDVQNYFTKLEKRIAFLEKKMEDLPQESIKCSQKSGHIYFYERTNTPQEQLKYIKKKDTKKIQPLLNALYIRKCLPVLKQNLKAAELFLNAHSQMEESTIIESAHEEIRKFNKNLFPDKKSIIEEWQSRPYKRNIYKEEFLTVKTVRGEMVRSKSEAIIANCLYTNNIPYKVECPLKLKQKTIYPDFTILNPITLEEIYWEHFGRMRDDEYADNACQKINLYSENNIILGEKLLASFESIGSPLSSNQVERLIKAFCK